MQIHSYTSDDFRNRDLDRFFIFWIVRLTRVSHSCVTILLLILILLLDKRAGCEVECRQDSFYPARPPLIVLARNRVEGDRLSYQSTILFKMHTEFQFV